MVVLCAKYVSGPHVLPFSGLGLVGIFPSLPLAQVLLHLLQMLILRRSGHPQSVKFHCFREARVHIVDLFVVALVRRRLRRRAYSVGVFWFLFAESIVGGSGLRVGLLGLLGHLQELRHVVGFDQSGFVLDFEQRAYFLHSYLAALVVLEDVVDELTADLPVGELRNVGPQKQSVELLLADRLVAVEVELPEQFHRRGVHPDVLAEFEQPHSHHLPPHLVLPPPRLFLLLHLDQLVSLRVYLLETAQVDAGLALGELSKHLERVGAGLGVDGQHGDDVQELHLGQLVEVARLEVLQELPQAHPGGAQELFEAGHEVEALRAGLDAFHARSHNQYYNPIA